MGGILLLRNQVHGPMRLILLSVVISFLSDYISRFVGINFGNNMPWFHIYTLIETLVYLRFFVHIGHWRFRKSELIVTLILILNSIFIEDILHFNTIARISQSLFLIALSLLHFKKIFTKETNFFIEKDPIFWSVVGIMVYFSGAFFSILFFEKILYSDNESVWIYHNVSNILKNLLFTLALCLKPKV